MVRTAAKRLARIPAPAAPPGQPAWPQNGHVALAPPRNTNIPAHQAKNRTSGDAMREMHPRNF
ncbi:MAG: hypothetical protein K8S55_01075 [Phycisphaerae bacterium]|nr:hypothetical protein [Phycisphaerae bacterium]